MISAPAPAPGPVHLPRLVTYLAMLGCAACGVQGPTRPPRIEQPERVMDLVAVQVGRSVHLSFTLPRTATDGERLTKPQEVEISQETLPAGAAIPSPPSASDWTPWRTLANEEVEKLRTGDSVNLTLPLSENEHPSTRLRFSLRTVVRGFRNRPLRGEASPAVTLALLDVPGALQGLQAMTTEKFIHVSWQAPLQRVTAYRVLRSLKGEADSFKLLAETVEPAYDDPDFVFGRTYFYKVRATVKGGDSTALSDDSPEVEITPRDTFPPQAPRGLTALYTSDAVELIWYASSEADLQGYFVYRRESQGSESKLTSEPLGTPIFRDSTVSAGKSYDYRITAVDATGNESGPSEPVTAEVP